ncbi:variable surface protein Vir4, putative [Plasmodium vivax]|uniref:Variable surface protein Vir4, putative n=1 Tax=Plasmodium vivax (strain Salvador I) TaxID=126793 RepID=A5KD50_PLAVS|nr:variable surface protein Vir4, putative [Plasmodium vivax]EDL42719.1 variable surface protein Vir4, putative [Plasmodium vivax]|eukprot:XP_001612512.1 variable surface protein Vir4 [Plasmodium vivax Sal-1]
MLGGSEKNWKEFEILTKSFSDDLISEIIYKQLDNLSGFNEYLNQCNSLPQLRMRQSLRITCARLLKYLKTYKFSKEDNEYDICILLNYWVYNRLNVILQSYNYSKIYQAFGEIGNIWSSFIEDNLKEVEKDTCKRMHNIVNHDDWRERKKLYDYYVNYSTIEKTIPNFTQKCPEYWTYVDSHTSLYEYFEKHCKNPKMKQKKADTLAKARQELQEGRSANQEQISGIPGSSEVSAGGSLMTRDGTHPVTQTGNILLGVVATSLTSGALYRFTPLGNMLRNRFGWNTNNMRNMHGGEYGLFDYASETYNPYTGGGEEHYIGYQPA